MKENYKCNIWDPATKQIFSTAEADIDDNCCEDDEYNLSDEPTAKRESIYNTEEAGMVQIEVPDVEITGETPAMFNDQDSVSTFRTVGQSTTKKSSRKNKPQQENLVTFVDTSAAPGLNGKEPVPQTESNINITGTTEDGSISRMSDTISRVSMLETQFFTIASDFTVAIQELQWQAQ